MSMTKQLKAVGFKSKQYGLTVVEYVLGAVALVLIIAAAVAAFGTPLKTAFEGIF
jgi:Flp pilus assembly pilin Flp